MEEGEEVEADLLPLPPALLYHLMGSHQRNLLRHRSSLVNFVS